MTHDLDIAALLEKYDRPVPRYTSYPTAVQFTHQVSQDRYGELLARVDGTKPVSVYIHVPFCHILCNFCGCHTRAVNDYGPAQDYLDRLFAEITLVQKALKSAPPLSRIHFGGGSPNFLKPADLHKIIEMVRACFTITEDTDIALEMDPRTLDEDNVAEILQAPITRVSLGIQDFNPDVQRAVNRIQPYEKVKGVVAALRAHGVKHLNFDMMYGLPLQTLAGLDESLDQAFSLSPDRFAIFGYAHVPWMKKQQVLLEKHDFPDGELRFEMLAHIQDRLADEGYQAIGIDHFAKKGDPLYEAWADHTLQRNFQGYTEDPARTIIGLGVSSISSFDDVYVQNTTDMPTYRRMLGQGEHPLARACILSDEDMTRRALIEQIMCWFEGDWAAVKALEPDPAATQERLEAFVEEGFIELEGTKIKVTKRGEPFTRVIASTFDTYFTATAGRHARAV